jgi:hypothetical protein
VAFGYPFATTIAAVGKSGRINMCFHRSRRHLSPHLQISILKQRRLWFLYKYVDFLLFISGYVNLEQNFKTAAGVSSRDTER